VPLSCVYIRAAKPRQIIAQRSAATAQGCVISITAPPAPFREDSYRFTIGGAGPMPTDPRLVKRGQGYQPKVCEAGPRLANHVAQVHDWWRRANAHRSSVCDAGPMLANHPHPTEEVLRSSQSSQNLQSDDKEVAGCIRRSTETECTRPPSGCAALVFNFIPSSALCPASPPKRPRVRTRAHSVKASACAPNFIPHRA
jgi:hypothetical protein